MSMSVLHCGAQNWLVVTSTECRGMITSLDLLAMLLLMQPRMTVVFFAARAHG